MGRATQAGFSAATEAKHPNKASPRDVNSSHTHYLYISALLSKHSTDEREFAQKIAVAEKRKTITEALNNRDKNVPDLAHRYFASSERINEALDILAIIRQM